MNMSGWNEEEYWGMEDEKIGRMQQLLRHLRKHLNVKIIFSKEHGVKLSEELVK
jgi:hypothetical protein